MIEANARFTPNCRYGHGDLKLVADENSSSKWGYISQASGNLIFSGDLYVCTRCGYTELFDDNVEQTQKNFQGQP